MRIERLWRDVRKDSLEIYRRIFLKLEQDQLLDMENDIQRLCLYRVFQPRIQASLDRTTSAWNNHKIRTAHYKTPLALFALSRQTAITKGYWTGDPGDPEETAADPLYGCDGGEVHGRFESTANEDPADWEEPQDGDEDAGTPEEGLEDEIGRYLDEMDLSLEVGNWGIDVYVDTVRKVYERLVESVELP